MACILLIDDVPAVRMTLRRLLEGAGYEVIEAGDGHEGLACLQTHAIDLVITDILMPGQGGYHVIRQVKSLRPQVKVLAISGGNVFSAQDVLQSATVVGADQTLTKPLYGPDFLAAVHTLLAKV